MKHHSKSQKKPNLDPKRFWDLDVEKMKWQQSYITVIQRILDRGTKEEWQELVNFYGKEKVKDTIRTKINDLPDDIIEEACTFFALKKEELKCYIRKQSLPKHWI